MDGNTPAWLQSNTTEAPAPAPVDNGGIISVPPPAPPQQTNSSNSDNTTAAAENDDPDLPGVILTMRLANMGVATAIIVVSVRHKKENTHTRFLCKRNSLRYGNRCSLGT
jgi:hypothetical protein